MPHMDVYSSPDGEGCVVDVQSNLLSHLRTRVVVPMLPEGLAPAPAGTLNPTFEIGTVRMVLLPQFTATVTTRELGPVIGTLAHRREDVVRALDLLLTGI